MLNFIDKSFSTKKAKQYRLSIQVDLDGFSFCVFDNLQKKHVALKSVPVSLNEDHRLLNEKIEAIYSDTSYLSLPFENCSCIYVSQKNTLIPTSFFIQDKLRPFLDFVYPLDELDEIHYKPIAGTNAIAVFAVPNPISVELFVKHKNIQFYNQSVPVVASLLRKKENQHLYININGSTIDLALSKSGQLVFHNSFVAKNVDDIIYFTLFSLKQQNVSPDQLSASIAGSLTNEIKASLLAYLPKATIDCAIKPSLPIASHYTSTYLQLLSLHLCE